MSEILYAKLIAPPQFKPNEAAKFRLEFSPSLTGGYVTLEIDSYKLYVNEKTYNGTVITDTVGSFSGAIWLGTGEAEITIPPNTLGELPNDDNSHLSISGKMKARAYFGNSLDENGKVIPITRTNEIIVDMLVMFDEDFQVTDDTLNANGSTHEITIRYAHRTYMGISGANDINSYKVLLYDNKYNLLSDSGTRYDWENSSEHYKNFKLTNLTNDTEYYVRVDATLVGGYVLKTDYKTLTVKYDPSPTINSKLVLNNDSVNGCVIVSLDTTEEYDKVVISRAVPNTNDYIELKTIHTNLFGRFCDYFALPNQEYMYKIILLKDDSIVASYYNYITHKLDGICVADAYAGYGALAWDSIYPINRNERGSIVEPMDSEFPYYIINGNLNYDSGSVNNALFVPMKNCEISTDDNSMYSKSIRIWLNNGRAKLLKYYNGECWLVATSIPSDEKTDMIRTSFNWVQIGDVNKNEDYIRLGLIVNE